MKVLFLSFRDSENGGGGTQCTFRNYQAICSYFGKENVKFLQVLVLRKRFKFLQLLLNKKEIVKNVKNIQIIFIDQSDFGSLAKSIKKMNPDARVITFFHNVEFDFAKQEYQKKKIRKAIYVKKIFENELNASNYSDFIFSLNSRDAQSIEKLYGRKINAIIPISFPNRCINFNNNAISVQPTALFLGINFFPNIYGITWFIKNVLPFVNIKLKIVGRGMDKINLPKNDKLEISGYVENLDIIMQDADFIVLPIFLGSGMKVKTCEALMHGKNIIGTNEAFQGYSVDFEKIGACCETAEEFIAAINEFSKRFSSKFNQYSRNLFLEKYSDEVVFKLFTNAFRELK
jgi:glycosyltransferase involved in cell wall biosynthesis